MSPASGQDGTAESLFRRLLVEQPEGEYQLAGCAKDGSGEGPPPKTPPPPPPPPGGGIDFREIIDQTVREATQGAMMIRVKPGAGFFGLARSPLEFVAPMAKSGGRERPKRAFMITYRDRGDVKEEGLPDLILEHAMHLRGLSDRGLLDSAAGYASGNASMLIVLTESKAEAERLAAEDPLLRAGYYRGFDMEELIKSVIGDC